MAYRIGVTGGYNTGKSFSRSFMRKGEENFVLSPSKKRLYLQDENGKELNQLLDARTQNSPNTEALMEAMGVTNRYSVFLNLMNKRKEAKYSGNWALVDHIRQLPIYLSIISEHMPEIKNVFMPDFTHYISKISVSKEFMDSAVGNKAYSRFYDLAADALRAFFLHTDTLRDDLVIITEFHQVMDTNTDTYKILVPLGKMLEEKFLPDSYYDVMLCTHVDPNEDGEYGPDSYKFVTRRWGQYNARSMEMFEDTLIPNNMQTVIDKVRETLNI